MSGPGKQISGDDGADFADSAGRVPMPAGLAGWINEAGRRLDLAFTPEQDFRFQRYFQLLREWNERVNLTAVVDDEGIAVRHLLDSLMLLPCLGQPGETASLIDVGTGAGLPGLPLKIMRPELRVVLLDALAKRIKFLDAVIEELMLPDITTLHNRAEDAARETTLREHFDIATARAVASLPALCEYCLPFVRTGGVFLAMKGQAEPECTEARNAIRILGGELADIHEYELPGTDMKRSIIQIRKVKPTPAAYPRRAGKPESQPLR
jgi:16S rRNA (guanine527-N7)-methyltransferase